ncbi:MAG: biotin transporter BioY, partial [Clostridium sp.]
GTAWLAGQLGMSFVAALGIGVIPYLPGDTAKIIIAIIAGPQIRKAVSRFM